MKYLIILFVVIVTALGQNDTSTTEQITDSNSTSLTGSEQTPILDEVGNDNTTQTTTAAPTTITITVPTTATGPTTTKSPATTTAPATPPGPPAVHTYAFNDTLGKYCIQMAAAVQFHVAYENAENKTVLAVFNARNGTVIPAASQCGGGGNRSEPARLAIAYDDFNLTYVFELSDGAKKYTLSSVQLDYKSAEYLFPSHVVNSNRLTLVAVLNETFEVSKDKSYRCDVEKKLNFDDVNNSSFTISQFKFVAFSEQALDNFGDVEECSDDFTTSDIVPIAVGCALAALVVIVLIAYLIGRRRSRQKGYQSV